MTSGGQIEMPTSQPLPEKSLSEWGKMGIRRQTWRLTENLPGKLLISTQSFLRHGKRRDSRTSLSTKEHRLITYGQPLIGIGNKSKNPPACEHPHRMSASPATTIGAGGNSWEDRAEVRNEQSFLSWLDCLCLFVGLFHLRENGFLLRLALWGLKFVLPVTPKRI